MDCETDKYLEEHLRICHEEVKEERFFCNDCVEEIYSGEELEEYMELKHKEKRRKNVMSNKIQFPRFKEIEGDK